MTTRESSLQKDEHDSQSNQPGYDNMCACKRCDHDLARDCLKVRCTCCKENDHSMVLDGIQGFFSTDDSKNNMI
jgi:hypothetical protein